MARASIILAVLATLGATNISPAVDAPYERDLLRLAEVLGSLHYLRNLCGESGETWRVEMERLIETEKPDADRKAKFVANFNRGYRSFETVYTTCTEAALESIRRYMKEGETLSREVATRFGN